MVVRECVFVSHDLLPGCVCINELYRALKAQHPTPASQGISLHCLLHSHRLSLQKVSIPFYTVFSGTFVLQSFSPVA